MPYSASSGFGFTVYDANVVKGNEVIGRAFISPQEAEELKSCDGSKILSLGDGVGTIKVNIGDVPKKLDKRIEVLEDIQKKEELET